MDSLTLLILIAGVPVIYPVIKLLKKRDLNCFDLILFFHTLYFVLIPLISDESDYAYDIVVNDSVIQTGAYLFYILFAFGLLFVNIIWTNSKVSNRLNLFNISLFIREWNKQLFFNKKISYFFLIICLLCWVNLSYRFMASADNYAMTRESLREELMANASILTMFTNSFFKTILSPVILLFISYLFFKKRKKIPISAIDVITLCGFIILLFVGSRTVMLNAFILSAFFYYSCYRDKITIKRLLSFGTVILLIIILVFPAVNLYRSSRMKVHAQYQGNLSFLNSMKEVFGLTASSYSLDMDDNNINARSVNVLQVFILSFDNDYIGDGELSKAAISFSLPKILFPNKSYKGSQILIEEELGVYTDIADSYLLFAKMDYGFIGFFVCILLFLMLLSIWDIYMKGTLLIFNDIYLKSYFIVMAINLCYYVEKSVDEILPQLLYSILYLLLYYGAIKLYKAIM